MMVNNAAAKCLRGISSWRSMVKGPFNYVEGKKTQTRQTTKEIEVTEPADGKIICTIQQSSKEDIDEVVKLAQRAQVTWTSSTTATQRAKVLQTAAEIIRKNVELLSHIEVKDSGKPIYECEAEILSCADAFDFFSGVCMLCSETGEHRPLVANSSFAYTKREPLGVCVGIGAWNFPFLIACWKAAPALACGNSFIFKPSPLTPLSAIALGEILTEAGLPDGLYNVIQGDGDIGASLCVHPGVAKVSFTGSIASGSAVMSACSSTVKKVTLELGGKSPLIIFDDFDIKNAVKVALMANYLSQGQVCSNASRIYIQEGIYTTFVDEFVKSVKKLKIGNPMEKSTMVGATINEAHANKVLQFISNSQKQGARILCGGHKIDVANKEMGIYLSPCVIDNVNDDMEIATEEVFGPVACVFSFKNEEEAVLRANNSRYGLAGGILTRDISRAHRVTSQLQCGTTYINNYNIYPPQLPFGGYKLSGIGRENGTAVVESYTQLKSTYVQIDDIIDCPLYVEN